MKIEDLVLQRKETLARISELERTLTELPSIRIPKPDGGPDPGHAMAFVRFVRVNQEVMIRIGRHDQVGECFTLHEAVCLARFILEWCDGDRDVPGSSGTS